MSRHNQYDSDWNDRTENEYYCDHPEERIDTYHPQADYSHSKPIDERDVLSYQSSSSYRDHYTYEPLPDEREYSIKPGQYGESDYYDRDSDRGFNVVSMSDHRRDYDEDDDYEIDYIVEPQHALPHDEQDLIGETPTRTDGIQMVARDFIDVQKTSGRLQIPKAVTVFGTMLFAGAITAWLLHSSQPELSAYDIVQLESYDGQQKTPAIFNLTDLNECTSLSDCIKDSLNESKADIARHTRETSALREIPAVNSTAPLVTDVAVQTEPATVVTTVNQVTDQLQVKKQWSIIRTTPSSNGDIITSLATGVNVRVLGSSGDWYEVKALNANGTQGFMHSSTLGTQDF